MDERHPALDHAGPLFDHGEPFIDRFAKELVQERIDNGHIDLPNMSFAQMEMLSHQIGRRVAQHLDREMTGRQSELSSDDYCCPTCGLECEAIKHKRTMHTIDGETEVIELKSYCHRCRRYFTTAGRTLFLRTARRPALAFPVRNMSGLDNRTFSPHARDRIVMAAAERHSYARAELMLGVLSEIPISSRQINRLTDEAGRVLRERQQQRVALHEQKKLTVEVRNIPELAVVETDGGRIRTRETQHGSGTHQPAWKESKTALFMRMTSETHESDPAPEPPDSLQNRGHVGELVRQMAGASASECDDGDASIKTAGQSSPTAKYESPRRLMRTCLASIDDADTFGKMMQAEAHRKGFFQANRKAFVADGMKCNWTIWKKHFGDFVPIIDFIHVVS